MQHQQDQCNTSKLQTNTVRWRDQHLDAQADEHKREAEKHASFMQINHEALNSIALGNFGGSFARMSWDAKAFLENKKKITRIVVDGYLLTISPQQSRDEPSARINEIITTATRPP